LTEANRARTVKIRRGRNCEREVAPDFARAMRAGRASAVAVHGRFGAQLYRGEADWAAVRRVAKAVEVPVIGSGDVSGPEEGRENARRDGGCGRDGCAWHLW